MKDIIYSAFFDAPQVINSNISIQDINGKTECLKKDYLLVKPAYRQGDQLQLKKFNNSILYSNYNELTISYKVTMNENFYQLFLNSLENYSYFLIKHSKEYISHYYKTIAGSIKENKSFENTYTIYDSSV